MKITSLEVKKFEQVQMGFGYNWFALALINDQVVTLMKQGGLDLWAFKGRESLSREDESYLDDVLNEELRIHIEYQVARPNFR